MIVEFNVVYNGTTETFANVVVNNDPPVQHEMDLGQQTLFTNILTQLLLLPNFNGGWLVESNKVADYISITLYASVLNPDTPYDMGVLIDSEDLFYNDMNDLTTLILDAVIP